jgi:putative ABC transport system ATP-binding protein
MTANVQAMIGPASSRSKTLLQGRNIEKIVGAPGNEFKVLKGIDVELYSGELTLLMGPSGSGKTTLLSILGCILTPTAGQLMVGSENATGLGAEGLADLRRRQIGFVFQSYNLFPTLTVLENVLVALDVREMATPDPIAYAKEALAAVGLTHRINTYPSKLSGGEKQRVAIARSLSGNASVVLADEPTAALDSENGKAVMALLAQVAKDPTRAVMAVTHDHRTLPYADRIIRIEDGKIASDERPNKNAKIPIAAEATH